MTDIKICAGCEEAIPLNLCIFFIPLPSAAAVRKEGQAPIPHSDEKIFAQSPSAPPTLEQSEIFLLCKNCAQLSQTHRGISFLLFFNFYIFFLFKYSF